MEHCTRKQARLISATPILHISAALATTHREAVPGVQGAHQAGVRHSVSDCSERQKLRGTATGPLYLSADGDSATGHTYPRSGTRPQATPIRGRGTRPQATPIRGRGLGHRSHLSAVGDSATGHTSPRSGTRPQLSAVGDSATGHTYQRSGLGFRPLAAGAAEPGSGKGSSVRR